MKDIEREHHCTDGWLENTDMCMTPACECLTPTDALLELAHHQSLALFARLNSRNALAPTIAEWLLLSVLYELSNQYA